MHIERTEYKKFVEKHILRPYQSDIMDADEPVDFSAGLYEQIPYLMEVRKNWKQKTFSRIARLNLVIDAGIFPSGMVGTLILAELHHFGIKIIYS